MTQVSSDAILFHFRKHHLKELKQHAQKCTDEEFRQHLLSLGLSMFDVYLGNLSSESIKEEICARLISEDIHSESSYLKWIEMGKGYQSMQLQDGSAWTLRMLAHTTFIHLHPSRYSAHTRRLKSQHLRQALWLVRNQLPFSEQGIQKCRKSLGMSPTGHFELNGLEAVYDLLVNI